MTLHRTPSSSASVYACCTCTHINLSLSLSSPPSFFCSLARSLAYPHSTLPSVGQETFVVGNTSATGTGRHVCYWYAISIRFSFFPSEAACCVVVPSCGSREMMMGMHRRPPCCFLPSFLSFFLPPSLLSFVLLSFFPSFSLSFLPSPSFLHTFSCLSSTFLFFPALFLLPRLSSCLFSDALFS